MGDLLINLVYMAKPRFGGWVSFTAHLAQKYHADLYKITKRTERTQRDYGYNTLYRNVTIDDLLQLKNLVITAIDKNYYKYLDKIPDGSIIVIHDPTEIRGKRCQPVLQNLSRFKIVTIRKNSSEVFKKNVQS